MRVLRPTIHGILDYAVVIAFALAPALLGLSGLPATLSYLLAGVHLLLTLVTAFPLGHVERAQVGFDKDDLNAIAAAMGARAVADVHDGLPHRKPGCSSRHLEHHDAGPAADPLKLYASAGKGASRIETSQDPYLALGDRTLALHHLTRILTQPYYISRATVRIDPTWESLHGDPRFDRLLAGH